VAFSYLCVGALFGPLPCHAGARVNQKASRQTALSGGCFCSPVRPCPHPTFSRWLRAPFLPWYKGTSLHISGGRSGTRAPPGRWAKEAILYDPMLAPMETVGPAMPVPFKLTLGALAPALPTFVLGLGDAYKIGSSIPDTIFANESTIFVFGQIKYKDIPEWSGRLCFAIYDGLGNADSGPVPFLTTWNR
jgi:hypothetical protein